MERHGITIDREAIAEFCRRNHIRKFASFGSFLTDEFGPESDIDVLVEFDSGEEPGFFRLADTEFELSDMLGPKADLRTPEDLSRYFREKVVAAAEVLYAASGWAASSGPCSLHARVDGVPASGQNVLTEAARSRGGNVPRRVVARWGSQGVSPLPSPAHTTWITWLADSQALNAIRTGASGGCLTPAQEEALGRAAIVALVAGFQAYVEALFEATAWCLTGKRPAVDRLKARHVEGQAGGRRFNNPDPDAVRSLFDQVLDVLAPGTDVWDGVSIGGRTSSDTRALLKIRLQERHMAAHGKRRFPLSVPEIGDRVREFMELVDRLDARAAAIVQSCTGRTPW